MDTQPEAEAPAQPAVPDNGVAGKQDQLLEIYKLHAQLMNDAIQRQLTINRFYQITVFGICILLGYIFSQKAEILWLGARKEKLLLGTLGLGIGFSTIWFFFAQAYIHEIIGKTAVLKNLEKQLAYPFLRKEQKIIDEQDSIGIRIRELLLPSMSLLGFCFSLWGALHRMRGKVSLFSFILPSGGFVVVLFGLMIPWAASFFKKRR